MIVALASNRVEGLAISKLTGIHYAWNVYRCFCL